MNIIMKASLLHRWDNCIFLSNVNGMCSSLNKIQYVECSLTRHIYSLKRFCSIETSHELTFDLESDKNFLLNKIYFKGLKTQICDWSYLFIFVWQEATHECAAPGKNQILPYRNGFSLHHHETSSHTDYWFLLSLA